MLKIRRRQHKTLAPLPGAESGASPDAAVAPAPQPLAKPDAPTAEAAGTKTSPASTPQRSASLKVRGEQMGALAEVSREEFIARMEVHLREHFAPAFKPVTCERLREFIVRNWKRANEYGLTTELGVCSFLETVAALGEDVLAAEPFASRMRAQERTELEKCELLNECVLHALEVNQR